MQFDQSNPNIDRAGDFIADQLVDLLFASGGPVRLTQDDALLAARTAWELGWQRFHDRAIGDDHKPGGFVFADSDDNPNRGNDNNDDALELEC